MLRAQESAGEGVPPGYPSGSTDYQVGQAQSCMCVIPSNTIMPQMLDVLTSKAVESMNLGRPTKSITQMIMVYQQKSADHGVAIRRHHITGKY